MSHVIKMGMLARNNEVGIATENGLYFIKLMVTEGGETSAGVDDLVRIEDVEEQYFRGYHVRGFFEYQKDFIAACFEGDSKLHIIDRR